MYLFKAQATGRYYWRLNSKLRTPAEENKEKTQSYLAVVCKSMFLSNSVCDFYLGRVKFDSPGIGEHKLSIVVFKRIFELMKLFPFSAC